MQEARPVRQLARQSCGQLNEPGAHVALPGARRQPLLVQRQKPEERVEVRAPLQQRDAAMSVGLRGRGGLLTWRGLRPCRTGHACRARLVHVHLGAAKGVGVLGRLGTTHHVHGTRRAKLELVERPPVLFELAAARN
eukprot:scaffold123396_cov30-Tisochrysis_lutea.AAC.4